MAGISVFPMAGGAIMRVSAQDVRLLIELSPVEITAIVDSLVNAGRIANVDHITVDALKTSLPSPARRIGRAT